MRVYPISFREHNELRKSNLARFQLGGDPSRHLGRDTRRAQLRSHADALAHGTQLGNREGEAGHGERSRLQSLTQYPVRRYRYSSFNTLAGLICLYIFDCRSSLHQCIYACSMYFCSVFEIYSSLYLWALWSAGPALRALSGAHCFGARAG